MAENENDSEACSETAKSTGLPRKLAKGALQGALAGTPAAVTSGSGTGLALGVGGGALLGLGKELVGWAVDQVQTSTDQLQSADRMLTAAREAEKVRALQERQEELEARVEQLRKKLGDEEPLASALHAAIAAWSRAWDSTHNSKKQRLITAVLVNTFDPECYEVGLSLRIMRLLEDLDYPELQLLRVIGEADRERPPTWDDAAVGSLRRDLIQRLGDAGLVWWPDAWNERLAVHNMRTPRISELGDHVLRLVESGWLHKDSESRGR